MAINTTTGLYEDFRTGNDLTSIIISDFEALKATLVNIFKTPYGDRSGCFRPGRGNRLKNFLQEPITSLTALHIKLYMIEDIRIGQPFVNLNIGQSDVVPLNDPNLPPGYLVTIVCDPSPYLQEKANFSFVLSR